MTMNGRTWSFLLTVALLVAVGASLYAHKAGDNDDQKSPTIDKYNVEPRESHIKRGPGQIQEVWIEDLIAWEKAKFDPAIFVSVTEQQSILWLSKKYEFRILEIRPLRVPPSLARTLEKGPFYRQFPVDPKDMERDGNRFFRQVSSGPVRLDADPGPDRPFAFKTTIEVKGYGKIDPHIMTIHDVGSLVSDGS